MREVNTRLIPKFEYPDFSHTPHILNVGRKMTLCAEDPFAWIRELSSMA
jgi:hypothetical protein